MEFNEGKLQLLRMGTNHLLKQETNLFTGDYTEIVCPSEALNDLGVQVDCHGTFEVQRKAAIKKTMDKAAWVLRTYSSRSPALMKMLWKSLTLPYMDYCLQLWSGAPSLTVLGEMEAPKRAFTKRVAGLQDIDYWDRLKSLLLLN